MDVGLESPMCVCVSGACPFSLPSGFPYPGIPHCFLVHKVSHLPWKFVVQELHLVWITASQGSQVSSNVGSTHELPTH